MTTFSLAVSGTRLALLQGDLTLQDTAAVVNAANSSLMGGGGVDGAIHRAGGPAILEECRRIAARIGRLEPGNAVVTTGGDLKADYVIHTVGPVWRGGARGEAETLRDAYTNSLVAARDAAIPSLSFPSISTGAYRFPVGPAAGIALGAVTDFLRAHRFDEVRMVLWSTADLEAYLAALGRYAAAAGMKVTRDDR